MTQVYGNDMPPVTEAQAAVLFRHHAELAKMYYEICNDSEMEDTVHQMPLAIQIFFRTLQAHYREMNETSEATSELIELMNGRDK